MKQEGAQSMRMIATLTAVLLLVGQTSLARAQASSTQPAPTVTAEQLKQALDQTQKALQEQAEVLRGLRQEMERQSKEIDAMRQLQPPITPAEAAAGAAQLQLATSALRTPASTPAKPTAKATANAPADLFFRIGNATFTPSGWIDFTAFFRTTNVGSGQGTNFQSIPYNNVAQGGQSEVRLTAQSSRIGIKVDETVGKIKAYGYLEVDFNGYLPGNAYVSTNSNTLRMRAYYLNLANGKWEILGGQGWSLLTPTRKALSPFLADLFNTFHIDTSYQAGLPYARQTQFRFVYHPTPFIAAGVSVENGEQFSGSAVTFPALFSTTETDTNSSNASSGGATSTPNVHPDIIAKATFDRNLYGKHYWHIGVAGLLTSTRVFTPASVTKSTSATDEHEGGGVVGNLNLELFKGFHLIAVGYWSDGGGRYMGGMGPGFVVLQPGTVTTPFKAALIHSGSGIGGFEWILPKRTTLASYYSSAYYQRRFALDPSLATPTYVGYGFPGSANSNNRTIQEYSLASITTLWQNPAYGALQILSQSSYVLRSPWYIAPNAPRDAHTFMEFTSLRYVIP
jgi:hypothetical protein